MKQRILIPTIAAALIVAALAGVALGWRSWRSEPRDAQTARQALADERYPDAAEALTRWLKSAPNDPQAHLLKGRLAVAMSLVPAANQSLEQARALSVAREDLALLSALIASKAGRHAEAEPTLRQAFDTAPAPDRQVDEALAKTYLETYDLTQATRVLDRWAHDFPADPKPYLWRAEVHGRTGDDPRGAENDFREALRRDASLARARLGLAEELRKAHRNAEAAQEYQTYLAANPDDAAAHLGAGRNLMENGDDRAATVLLERALALNPKNAEPLKELADAASRRGDWAASLAILDRALAVDPHDVTVRHSRGLALAHLGRTEEARAEQAVATRLRSELARLEAARARLINSPHDLQSQLEITRWMFDHGHDQEGARWAEKILAEHPGDADASRLLTAHHERRGEMGLANYYRLQASTAPGTSH